MEKNSIAIYIKIKVFCMCLETATMFGKRILSHIVEGILSHIVERILSHIARILYVIVYNALYTYVLLVLICLCTTSPEQGLVLSCRRAFFLLVFFIDLQ